MSLAEFLETELPAYPTSGNPQQIVEYTAVRKLRFFFTGDFRSDPVGFGVPEERLEEANKLLTLAGFTKEGLGIAQGDIDDRLSDFYTVRAQNLLDWLYVLPSRGKDNDSALEKFEEFRVKSGHPLEYFRSEPEYSGLYMRLDDQGFHPAIPPAIPPLTQEYLDAIRSRGYFRAAIYHLENAKRFHESYLEDSTRESSLEKRDSCLAEFEKYRTKGKFTLRQLNTNPFAMVELGSKNYAFDGNVQMAFKSNLQP